MTETQRILDADKNSYACCGLRTVPRSVTSGFRARSSLCCTAIIGSVMFIYWWRQLRIARNTRKDTKNFRSKIDGIPFHHFLSRLPFV